MTPAKPKTNKNLLQITKAIKALEKKSIQNLVEIGKLLCEASEQIEHGEYMPWLKNEFGWSHDTSLNYRNVYVLSQNPNFSDFAKLNISITALYLAARYLKDDDNQVAGVAIIEAARHGRVSYRMAQAIIEEHKPAPVEPDPPQVDQEPAHVSAPESEPDDEPELEQDDESESDADDDESGADTDDESQPDTDDAPDSPDDDSLPPAPPLIPDVDRTEAYARLADPVHDLIGVTVADPAWPAVIKDIGAARLLTIIQVLQAVYDAHCERREVESAADRAEAKAKVRLN